MKKSARDALSLALDDTEISNGQFGFYNAVSLPDLEEELKHQLICEQGFRPDYLSLEKQRYSVVPKFQDDEQFAHAIVLVGRNRKVNESNICRAWNATQHGGTLWIAGEKTSGITPLRKWAAIKTEITDSFSKFHSVVFRLKKSGNDWPVPNLTRQIDEYEIAEGMFSSDGPDKGSRLLIEHFDDRIRGHVADIGAGWGYLSKEVLKRSNKVKTLDLFEADYASLEAAKLNLLGKAPFFPLSSVSHSSSSSGLSRGSNEGAYTTDPPLDPLDKPEDDAGIGTKADESGGIPTSFNFHWSDVTSEFPKKPYDWVIMNPPFHSGRATVPGLGQRFIEVAASTLPRGGRLLMVANNHLPYEIVLEKCFHRFETLTEHDGFKVIEAVR